MASTYHEWLSYLALALSVASAIGCIFLLGAAMAVRRFAARPRLRTRRGEAVSVLKPLCGEDAGLAENLRSLLRQDYGQYQVVCGVSDEADPALSVVRRLVAELPGADVAVVVDGRRLGSNLKVSNLANMLPAARHPVLVIADSDMRVSESYLAEVTAPLDDPAVGIVTCLYRGISAGGLWSDLACLHINHGFLPQALVADALGVGGGSFGATLALARETLARAGGFPAIADQLADDHALGAAVRGLGLRLVLSPYLVDNIVAEPTFGALFRHELRWARTQRLLAPVGFAGSVITHPVALALLAAATGGFPALTLGMVVLAVVLRCLTVRLNDRALGLKSTPIAVILPRDLLSFGVFVASFFVRTVAWRRSSFRVGRDGALTLDGDRPA